MAKGKYVQKGETINYKNSGNAAIEYKDVIPLVSRIGIAGENIAVGAIGAVHVDGVYELPAVSNAAFAVGDELYWDNTAGKLTKTSENNTAAGWCVEVKAEATALAYVKIG